MIVVFGSINIDLIVPVERLPRPGETVLGPGYTLIPGGKGANQALAATRAGSTVHMVGRVGRDGFSDLALAELKAAGTDLAAVQRDDLPTGCALIPVERSGQNLIIVAAGANRAVVASQVDDRLLSPQALVAFQMEVPADENWKLVRRAKSRGARVMLNCAPAAPVPRDIMSELDWLIVNETEAELVAQSLSLPSAKDVAAATGVTVIVTLGEQGAIAYGPRESWRVGVLPIDPLDTVGAGDAFVGAFAASIDAGATLTTALHRASVAGSLACTVRGAQPSLPMKDVIDRRASELPPASRL